MRAIYVGLVVVCVCSLLFGGRAEAQSLTYPLGLGNPSQMGPGFENLQQDDNQTGIKLGPFRFKPGLQFNSTYTDNAKFTNQNKESAFLFSVDPSFSFTLSKGMKLKDYLSFGYDGDLGAYLNLGSYNYTTHNLWADLNLMERPTTYMRLRETISYTDNPYGNPGVRRSWHGRQPVTQPGGFRRRAQTPRELLRGTRLPERLGELFSRDL